MNAAITFRNAAEAITALYVCGHLASNHAEASSDDTRCLAVVPAADDSQPRGVLGPGYRTVASATLGVPNGHAGCSLNNTFNETLTAHRDQPTAGSLTL